MLGKKTGAGRIPAQERGGTEMSKNSVGFEAVVKLLKNKGMLERCRQLGRKSPSFLCIEGSAGRRLYVKNGHTVNRVDVAGWEMPGSLEFLDKNKRPTAPPSGAVTGWLSIERDGLKKLEEALLQIDGPVTVALKKNAPGKGPKPGLAAALEAIEAEEMEEATKPEIE